MPSPNLFDLVDIDLNATQDPSVATGPGPPSLGADPGSCPQNPTAGSRAYPGASLPLANANCLPAAQRTRSMGPNPNGVCEETDLPQLSHPSVGMQNSLPPTYLPGSGCNGLLPPSDLAVTSAIVPCPANVDIRAALITEAVARRAFLAYGNSHYCYSSAPAKRMTFQELQPINTYRYCLETFTESRACELVTEHYTGQAVDSSPNAAAPQPWDIPVAVPNLFMDGMQKMVVPHTFTVKNCPRCDGLGRNMCLKCHGTGRVQCVWCNGTGRRMQMEMCHACYGSGTESCRVCDTSCIPHCVTCAGKGQVVTYMRMTVTWKNNVFEFISDYNSEFSSDLFKNVKGETIFMEEHLLVSPLANFPDPTLTRVSQNALEQHQTQFSTSCRILRQKQSVELLPLTKVQYSWKGQQLSYFVYGKENMVYVQDYPQKCCCGVM